MSSRAILVVLLFLILITLPYFRAEMAGGADSVFGGFLLNPIDGNSYLAKMYQGWRGEWRFTLPYTAQPGEGAYLFLFYLFLGHVARVAGLSTLAVFHLARLLSAIALVLALRRFLLVTFSGTRLSGESVEPGEDLGKDRQSSVQFTPKPVPIFSLDLVFSLALLGLGLGWMAFPFGAITSDLLVPEAYPFLSAYANPHFALGLALLLYLLTFQPEERTRNRVVDDAQNLREPRKKSKISTRNYHLSLRGAFYATKQSLAALLLSVISPFGVIVALFVLGALVAWELGERIYRTHRVNTGDNLPQDGRFDHGSNPFHRCILVFFFGAPLLLYDFWVTRIDPVLAGWNAQNLTPSPPPWDILLAFSPALILGLVGVSSHWHIPDRRFRLLLTWVVAAAILVYLPIGLQRRFMMGLSVPVVGLAGFALTWLESKKHRLAEVLGKLVFILSLPTTLLVLLIGQYGVQTRDPWLYLTRGEIQALNWIEENTPDRALILASPETGLFIPAHTGRRVIYGHPYETVNAEAEKQATIQFFQEANSNEPFVQDFLSERGVDFVFYGPRERLLGSLPQMESLIPVFSAGDVEVYQHLR